MDLNMIKKGPRSSVWGSKFCSGELVVLRGLKVFRLVDNVIARYSSHIERLIHIAHFPSTTLTR